METGNSERYFALQPDCFLVKGARRGALYDLASGDVYSIDPVAVKVVELCEARQAVAAIPGQVPEADPDEICAYLHQIAEAGLGGFSPCPRERGRIDLERRYDRLDYVWFELREDCNLRCCHCYCMSKARTGVTDRLTFAEWQRLLDESAALGCRAVQFIGGEPLLFGERLFQLADRAGDLGFESIELFSNLTFLKEEWITRMLDLQMKVSCSLFSKRPEVHDGITGFPGSLARTLRNVRRLRERGLNPRFAVTAMKHNQDYLEETMDFLREMGVKKPYFDLVRPSGRGNDDELVPDKLSKKERYRTRADFMQTDRETFLRRYNGNSCWQGKVAIGSTGDVFPCIMQRDESAGNVRRGSLREIIANGIRKFWDLSYDKIEVCQDCEYRYACHDCRPVTYGPTGELTAKSLHCSYDPYRGEFQDLS